MPAKVFATPQRGSTPACALMTSSRFPPAPDCPAGSGPCEVEIPWFIEFEQKYKDRDFAVLGVSFDDDGWKSVRPYIAAHKINYRIMIGTEKMSQLYGGVDSLPTSFIVDRQGRIAA